IHPFLIFCNSLPSLRCDGSICANILQTNINNMICHDTLTRLYEERETTCINSCASWKCLPLSIWIKYFSYFRKTKRKIMRILFVITALMLSLSASGQEYGKKFVDIYVNINGQDPKSFVMEDDTLKITSGWFEPKNFILEINNKTSGMLYVDFNKSYFILGGETSDVVPGETYIKDLNLEVKKTKVAPGARASLNLYSRERNNEFNPIFSSRQAHKAYKTDKSFL